MTTIKHLFKSTFILAICSVSLGVHAQQHTGLCFVNAPGSPFNAVGAGPGNIASGDFNSDGIKDLAVANTSTSKVYIYNGNGNGSFTAGTIISSAYPGCVASGDFNGDGKNDLAICNSGSKVSIYLGSGTGTFGTPTTYNNIYTYSTLITVSDVNNDGKQDLIINSTQGNPYFYIMLGNGLGAFSCTQYIAGHEDMLGFCIGDVNADNNKDLVMSLGTMTLGRPADVAYGNGTNYFTPVPSSSNSTFVSSYNGGFSHLALGDFNEDGKPDIAEIMSATANQAKNFIFIGLNTGASGANYNTVTSYPTGTNPNWVGVADFNMDNHLDLAVVNYDGNNISILVGDGQGHFAAPVNFATDVNPSSAVIDDFSGDGFPDIAITNNGSNTVSVYLNGMPRVVTPAVSICAGNSATLNATVTGASAYTYLWSNGATSLSTVVTPPATTSYNFTATNTLNTCSTINTVQVTVNNPSPFSVSGASICAGSSTPLSVSPAQWLTSYAWLPASGLNTYSGTSVVASPAATTVYTITSTNFLGCTYSTSATVVVKPLPTVVVPSQGACVGESATLTASGAASYVWFPSSSLSSSTGSSVIASPSGTTLYTIVGTGSNGCTNSTTALVTISTRPEIRIGPSTPDSPQHLQPTKFYSSASGSSYVWNVSTALISSVSFAGQGTSSINSVAWQAPTNIESTLQKVTLKLDGCSTSLFLPLNNATGGAVKLCAINGPTTVAPSSIQVYSINCGTSLIPGNTWFCDGGTITSGQGTGSVTIKWGSGYVGRLGYQAVGSTGQNSTLDVAICSAVAPVNPSNNSILTPNPMTICHSWGSTHVTAANSGSTYLWSTGATVQTISAPVNSTGYADYYYVTVTNTNGCKSSFFQTVITNLGCREAGINSNSVSEVRADAVFYPNPATNKLLFESQEGDAIGKVIITNSLGEIVFEKDINVDKAEFDISHFASGVYVIYNRGAKGKLVKE